MQTVMKTLGALFLIAVIGAIGMGGCTASTYNTMIRSENGIKNNKPNVMVCVDKVVKQMESQGMIFDNGAEILLKSITAAVGPNGRGSEGFVKAMHEAYPQIPEAMLRDMTATSNSAYAELAAVQSGQLDRITTYENQLGLLQYQLAKNLGGFPRINLDDFRNPIVGHAARDADKTREFETVDPFRKNKQPEKG